MATVKPQRISIGFTGGQVLAARVQVADREALETALDSGKGWYQLACEDATVRLDLGQVVFVRTDSDEPRVGFGA
jgi:hypothetical protein